MKVGKRNTPLPRIRNFCRWCSNGGHKAVLDCKYKDCALWPFRLGKNPNMAGRQSNISYITGDQP